MKTVLAPPRRAHIQEKAILKLFDPESPTSTSKKYTAHRDSSHLKRAYLFWLNTSRIRVDPNFGQRIRIARDPLIIEPKGKNQRRQERETKISDICAR